MRIEISKRDLLEALDRVKHTISGSKMVQILQCFCFREGRVSTYNGSSGTTTKLDLQGADFAIEAIKFYRLIASLFDTITLDIDESKVIIESGSGTYKLGTFPTKGFPEIIQDNFEDLCLATNFTEALVRVAFTVGQNATKPALMGVGIAGDHVYSSDGMRISRAKLQAPVSKQALIQAQAVQHIISLGQPTSTFTNDNVVGAFYESTKTVYISAQVAAKFPVGAAEERLRPKEESHIIDFPEDLPAAIDRVRMVTGVENEIRVEHNGQGWLTLSAQSEVGDGEELLEMPTKDAPAFVFAVKPEWLKRGFECTRKVDITDVVRGEKRTLRFIDEGFDHVLALMTLRD